MSFERIHRSNLVGMGVLPLQFLEGTTAQTLGLDGSEIFDLLGLGDETYPGQMLTLVIHRANGTAEEVTLRSRIDTANRGRLLPPPAASCRMSWRELPNCQQITRKKRASRKAAKEEKQA